jgi:hypothetical protein
VLPGVCVFKWVGVGATARACACAHVGLLIRCVSSLVRPTFSTLFHKRCDFRKNVIELKMCGLIFFKILYETFFI